MMMMKMTPPASKPPMIVPPTKKKVPEKKKKVMTSSLTTIAGKDLESKKSGISRTSCVTENDRTISYIAFQRRLHLKPKAILILFPATSQTAEEMMATVMYELVRQKKTTQYDAVFSVEGPSQQQDARKKQKYPTPLEILNHYDDFVQHVLTKVASSKKRSIDMMGYSFGAAMAYHVRARRHDDASFRRMTLIAPLLEACLSNDYMQNMAKMQKEYFAFQDRLEMSQVLADMGQDPSKPESKLMRFDPFPKLLMAAFLKLRKLQAQTPNYWQLYMDTLQQNVGTVEEMGIKVNSLGHEKMLVLVPPNDPVCDYKNTSKFFGGASSVVQAISIDGAGHGYIKPTGANNRSSKGKPLLNSVVSEAVDFISKP